MRYCLCLLALAVGALHAAESLPGEALQGTLRLRAGQPPAVETVDHKLVTLAGDDSTGKILHDQRLDGFAVEARGHFTAPGQFLIDPVHTHSLLVRKDGRLRMIAYFCEVCNIRSYTPGPCVCCQRETVLDLRDPDEK